MSFRRSFLGLACTAALLACSEAAPPRSPQADSDLELLVDSMLPALARLAALEPRAELRLERQDSAAVRAYLEQRLDEELPPAALHALHTTYALLGLVPDSLDLRALLLQLYREQIVGYYDPHRKTLYVVEGVPASSVAPVLAHELVHALQDQYANLDSLIDRARGNDRQTAAHAAFEGHATIVMFAWLAQQGRQRDLDPTSLPNPAGELAAGLRAQNEQFPVFRDAPAILRETLLFPYIGGADFMYRLWQAQPLDRPAPLGHWLPQSTEQVLHPDERFLRERDQPTEIVIAAQPPGAWQTTGEDNTLGELETGIFLAQHLGEPARRFARGWDGDRYRLLTREGGGEALLWYTVWDDAAAANAFLAALQRVGAHLGDRRFTAERRVLDGRPAVRLLVYGAPEAPAPAALPGASLGTQD